MVAANAFQNSASWMNQMRTRRKFRLERLRPPVLECALQAPNKFSGSVDGFGSPDSGQRPGLARSSGRSSHRIQSPAGTVCLLHLARTRFRPARISSRSDQAQVAGLLAVWRLFSAWWRWLPCAALHLRSHRQHRHQQDGSYDPQFQGFRQRRRGRLLRPHRPRYRSPDSKERSAGLQVIRQLNLDKQPEFGGSDETPSDFAGPHHRRAAAGLGKDHGPARRIQRRPARLAGTQHQNHRNPLPQRGQESRGQRGKYTRSTPTSNRTSRPALSPPCRPRTGFPSSWSISR